MAEGVVLLTGVSSGIGAATAKALVDEGFSVFGTSRNPESVQISGLAGVFSLDVCSDESVEECFRVLRRQGHEVDILVNNAGYVLTGAIEDTSLEEARAQFETNFFGVLRMVREVLPGMRERRSGTIINVTSLAGRVPAPPFWGIYSASKHALRSYTEHLWREAKPFGVRVALVEPGPIRTALGANGSSTDAAVSEYDPWRKHALAAANRSMDNGPGPEVVARTIRSIVLGRSTRLHHLVGREALVVPRLRQIVPHAFFERQLKGVFDIKDMP